MYKDFAIGIVVATLFLSVLALLFAILIKIYVHKIRKYNRVILEKDLAHQKALTTLVIETQEQVLENISRDLHDDAGQQLTYINFQVENLKLDSEAMQHLLQPVTDSLRGLSESIRGISHSLNNQLITKKNLVQSIKSELERLSRSSPFKISADITCDDAVPFSQNEKIVIYRIFQENMSNIFRHSRARNVWVTIADSPFTMAISDDGQGFDPSAASDDSIGLANMKNRAALIGYELHIASAPGKGTTITLSNHNHGTNQDRDHR